MQVNLQHAKAASYVLSKKFNEEQIDLAFIQEPWIANTGRISGLSGASGKVVSFGVKPRACLVIKNKINYFILSGFCSRDATAVHLKVPVGESKMDIVVCSAYFPGDRNADMPPTKEVRELVAFCRRKNFHLIVGCDANSHHTAWGSTDINQRGESLFNFLLGEGLMVNNLGSEPTFVTKNQRQVLDLTISSNYLSTKISKWMVSSEPSCSDHRIIQFEIAAGEKHVVKYRDQKCTDWNGYIRTLRENMDNVITTIETRNMTELAAKQLSEAVVSAYYENCPLKTKTDNRGTSWWNRKLEKQRREVRRLFNRAKMSGGWDEYRTALTKYNKDMRKTKRESWRRFCESIIDVPSSNRIHKILSREPTSEIGSFKRPDGTYTTSRKETLELLARNHFPDCRIQEDGDENADWTLLGRKERPEEVDWTVANKIISYEVIDWAIQSFKPYKSPGEDGIFPALLQQGRKILIPYLVKLFRASLAWGYIPSNWSKVKVIYIPKAGRVEPHPKSFRPISLTSFLLKTLEKAVEAHLRGKILSKNPLNQNQYAYQRGKSTELALYNLVEELTRSLEGGEIALAVFFDIEGAFNNTLPKSISEAVAARGTEKTIVQWIRALLEHRIVTTSLQDEVVRFTPGRGCPQGGVLSPTLWSLLVDDLLAIIGQGDVYVQAYADDVVIVIRGINESAMSRTLQETLNTIQKWCEREGMNIHPHKTTIVPFTRKRRLKNLKPLTIQGEIIPFAEEAKYLGVTLDKKLNWNSHLDKIIRKAKLSLWSCRRICGRTWGLTPKNIYWLYVTVIRPAIVYGSIVWWPKTLQKIATARLTGVQRLASLSITGAMNTTPSVAMEILLDLPPLHLVVQREARLVAYKFSHTVDELPKSQTGGPTGGMQELLGGNILQMTADIMTTKIRYRLPYKVLFPSRDEWEGNQTTLTRADLCLYTDGSKTEFGAGAGIYGGIPNTNVAYSVGKLATIFQAEVYAIEMCARRLAEWSLEKKSIKIFSDSQAALKALGSKLSTSKLVWNCQETLSHLGQRNRVELIWIPGHSGVGGNEHADALARRGSAMNFMGPEPVIGISIDMVKKAITSWMEDEVLRYWRECPGMEHSKAFIDGPSKKRTRQWLELSRKKVRTLTALYTGHCRLKHHLSKIGLLEEGECRLCMEDDETPGHILCACPAGDRIRSQLFGKRKIAVEDLKNLSPSQILDFINKLDMGGEI